MYKPKFDNWLEAQATLEGGMYMLKQLQGKTRSPIESMIDEATGYGMAIQSRNALTARGIVEDMIEAQEYLGMDTKRLKQLYEDLEKIIGKKQF